jgi:AraC-like DNA-binding protein
MNTRTLQRRLSAEGSNFNAIVKAIRSDLARQYLLKTQISLTNMAAYLG